MSRPPDEEPVEERLRQLLAVEARLQSLVRDAQAAAARRVADAQAAADRVRRADREQEARVAAEEEGAAQAALTAALRQIADEHEKTLSAISGVSDSSIDALAYRAIDRAIRTDGDDP